MSEFIILYNREKDSEVPAIIYYIPNLLRSICYMIRQYVRRQSTVRFDFSRHGSCVGVLIQGRSQYPGAILKKEPII